MSTNKLVILLAAACAAVSCAIADGGPSASKATRGKYMELAEFEGADVVVNDGWKFRHGDADEFAKKDFDDSQWRSLDLPHDFQMELPWDKGASPALGYKPLGTAWYRKHFSISPDWRDKRIFIEFEAIMAVGDVFLNSEKIGSVEYGYLGTTLEITGKVNFDGENVIAVRADCGRAGGSRWYTGGGITRDVHLYAKSRICIPEGGFYVVSNVEGGEANITASVELDGFRGLGRDNELEVVVEIFEPSGKSVGSASAKAPWSKLERQCVTLPDVKIFSPALWDIDAPNLYTAVATVKLNGKTIDRATERFGIRKIEFDKDFGFKLNGRKVWLQGMANHADYGALGAAVFDRAIERQLRTMKAFGYNTLRCSHNPYSKSLLRLADELGVLVVDELIDKWSVKNDFWNGRVSFMSIWQDLIYRWVRRDRNHPSVIMWSLANETQMTENLCGFQTSDWGVTTYRIFDIFTKRWDATRPTTVAMFPAREGAVTRKDKGFHDDPKPPELACVTEVASFNYVFDDYASYKRHAPHLNIFQSEATVRQLQQPILGMDKATTVGLAYWGAIDYWGESSGWPKKGWCYSFFDRTLQPHTTAYLIKSFFSEEPLVRIGTIKGKEVDGVMWNDIDVGRVNTKEDWNFPDGSKVLLYTYTNADEVELFVNSKSVGVKKNDRADPKSANAIRWQDVPYEKGEVLAVARSGGKEIACHFLRTAGEPVRLEIVAENPGDWNAGGQDLLYVRVTAVDSEGCRVRACRENVKFSVSGAASLYAVDDGDPYTQFLFHGVDSKPLADGSLLVILRSGREPGDVTLTATPDSISPASAKFATRAQ